MDSDSYFYTAYGKSPLWAILCFDGALYHYGIIPERVVEVTSMTTRRGKVYDLSIGRFSYAHSPLDFYPFGIDRVENIDKTGFLMASPEKVLCDKLQMHGNWVLH